MHTVVDKAGEKYWTNVWEHTALPEPIIPDSDALHNHLNKRFHEIFLDVLGKMETRNRKFIEIGCGNSVWLPYFHKQFGFDIFGLDYSEVGCIQSRKILENQQVPGEIRCGDLFNPPVEFVGAFDFLISMGVVEHFSDTKAVISSLKKFLKPGGVLITTIPNHAGLLGFLQKLFNRPVYDIHKILDRKQLNEAILNNNMELLFSKYVVSAGFYINLDSRDKKLSLLPVRKFFAKWFSALTNVIWLIESRTGRFPEVRFFSPAIITVARVKS